jgi:hypothetical protein
MRMARSVTTDSDLIAPASVDRRPFDHVRSGQSYLRSFAVQALPRMMKANLLNPLMVLPGVQVTVVNNPLSRTAARERLVEKARAMGVSVNQKHGDESMDEALALRDIRRILSGITEETTGLHLVGIYLTIAADDLQTLRERTNQVLDLCIDLQLTLVPTDYQHWEGMLTTVPLGRDDLRYLFETDTQTVALMLPSASVGLQGGQGIPILYGVRAEGRGSNQGMGAPVLLDRFALRSPHQVKIAATGGGKTYQQSWELLQRFAHGTCDICVLDPKDQEYRQLLEDVMGGTYVVMSSRSEFQINPLALPWGDATVTERLVTVNAEILMERAGMVKQMVATECQARGMPLQSNQETEIEEAILACYDRRGITEDPRTFHGDVPTMRDVAAELRERNVDDRLMNGLALFTEGSLGRLLNGENALALRIPRSRKRPDVGVLGIDLSAFLRGRDETLKRVLPGLIADYFLVVGMSGSGRQMEVVIDEAWSILGTPAGAQIIGTFGRVGRSLSVAATVISQQVREFLWIGETPNAGGRAFLEAAETVLLLPQLRGARSRNADNPVNMAAEQFDLSPGMRTWLGQCRRDELGTTALLIAAREPIPLRIPRAPGPIHAMIPGKGGKVAALEELDM